MLPHAPCTHITFAQPELKQIPLCFSVIMMCMDCFHLWDPQTTLLYNYELFENMKTTKQMHQTMPPFYIITTINM